MAWLSMTLACFSTACLCCAAVALCAWCCCHAVQAISSIPQSTLRELLPVLSGIDSSKLTAQLKLLGQQDRETINKMTSFLKAVRHTTSPLN